MTENKSKIHQKCYEQHTAITTLMTKLLFFKDDEEERQIMRSAPKDQQQDYGLNEREAKAKTHKRFLDKEKVAVLDKYIFPSMANLRFFFKSIAAYPQLREVFEDDIKDLLGIRRNNPQPDNYGFIIFNLLHSILLTGEGVCNEKRRHNKDFRLRLNQLLQETVRAKVDASLTDVFNNESAQRTVADDFNRVWGWTRMLAQSIDQSVEDNIPPRRTIKSRAIPLREHDEPI